MSRKILPVIMCGGAGTRVWPESRETMPKQFIPLIGKSRPFRTRCGASTTRLRCADRRHQPRLSFSRQGAARGNRRAGDDRHSSRRGAIPGRRSRSRRNWRQSTTRDDRGGVRGRPRDPRPERVSGACAAAAEAAADGYIVTLGVTPSEPAVGYGYIRPGAPIGAGKARRGGGFRREARSRRPPSATSPPAISGIPAISSFAPTSCSTKCARSSLKWPRRRRARSRAPPTTSGSSRSTRRRSPTRRRNRSITP